MDKRVRQFSDLQKEQEEEQQEEAEGNKNENKERKDLNQYDGEKEEKGTFNHNKRARRKMCLKPKED